MIFRHFYLIADATENTILRNTIFPLNIFIAICKVILLIFNELSNSRPYYNNEIKFVRTLQATVCKFGYDFRIRMPRNRGT